MRKSRHENSIDSPDMTPMLDIVFIMLIFFIVSTSFVQEEAIDWLTLKQSSDPIPPTKDKPLQLVINKNGDMKLQGQLVSAEALLARVQSERAKADFQSAVVSVAPSVSTAILVKAVDDIKRAGIRSVSVGKSQ